MLKNALPNINSILFVNRYGLLQNKKMHDLKAKIYGDQQKTFWLKLKFFIKEMKYTLVQGSKDLWADFKWIRLLHKNKARFEFTGYELTRSKRIIIDLLKFIPYSVILFVPFAELALPVILYLYPNAAPSFYIFDTAFDSRGVEFEKKQDEAHKLLLQRLLKVLRDLSKSQQSFTHYDEFKSDFFDIIDELDSRLNFKNFTSHELMTVLQFMGGDYFEGTTTINKIVNLIPGVLPRWLVYKPYRYLKHKIRGEESPPYVDPWWIKQNFRILRFDYHPFENLKRKWLIWQIERKFTHIKQQDLAFERYGMKDVKLCEIKYYARERGLAGLTCYETLRNVINNDWVKITTHPRFVSNNTKLWYSVMMYNFMKKANKDQN